GAMSDFDTSNGYQIAGGILFGMALVGLGSNLTVVIFLKSTKSLSNTFGNLTLSQAIVDSIHQALFAFYKAPSIFFRNKGLYDLS
ncbi:hypothetical protein PMAYCL1PPCAC_32291, partial [Pristionchus mayeri]